MADVRLARNWSKPRVEDCLGKRVRIELVRFLRERYTERFFDPIRCLSSAPGNEQGYGFAIMALCCLLIETLECYRKGLPSTSRNEMDELSQLLANQTAPTECKLVDPFQDQSRKAFKDFFSRSEIQQFFPGIDGSDFYSNIRCGLLHQAQTKDGWRITRSGKFWEGPPARTINRDEFAQRLSDYFEFFLKELENQHDWNKEPWLSTRKKIYWLVQTA